MLAISPFLLAGYGGQMAAKSIRDPKKRRGSTCIFWGIALLGIIAGCVFQYRAVKSDQAHSFQESTDHQTWERYHQEDLNAIQALSRPGGSTPQNLADAWGKISSAPPEKVRPKSATPTIPTLLQRRSINAEDLAKTVRQSGVVATATVINDGTVEAGAFAKQLEIGLRMAGWTVGGDNAKIGDPDFFPDSLTLEVSANPVSSEDHSLAEADDLATVLRGQGVAATVRLTTLAFPPNFMRIKVSGQ